MMDSKIGNAELTGVAEGVEQKLHLDVTEILNKVILLTLSRLGPPPLVLITCCTLKNAAMNSNFLTISVIMPLKF